MPNAEQALIFSLNVRAWRRALRCSRNPYAALQFENIARKRSVYTAHWIRPSTARLHVRSSGNPGALTHKRGRERLKHPMDIHSPKGQFMLAAVLM